MFLYDVNRPVDGAWRSPYAPTPHTDTPLHGVTEPTVRWHTHLSLVHSLSPNSSPSSSLPPRRASSVGSSQLAAALIPVKLGPRPRLSGSVGLSGSPRLPRSSHYPWLEWAHYHRRLQDTATTESIPLCA